MSEANKKTTVTKIPIFEEIQTNRFDLTYLIKLFKSKKIGQVPYYIVVYYMEGEELQEALDNISEALITLKHNPYFPYPFYVVTDKLKTHHHLPLVNAVENLPRHYFKKTRRLKTIEMTLLNKNTIVAAKIANTDIDAMFKTIDQVTNYQRQLYDLSKEVDYYERVMARLSQGKKQKNESDA